MILVYDPARPRTVVRVKGVLIKARYQRFPPEGHSVEIDERGMAVTMNIEDGRRERGLIEWIGRQNPQESTPFFGHR
jgi:hypothetical protein